MDFWQIFTARGLLPHQKTNKWKAASPSTEFVPPVLFLKQLQEVGLDGEQLMEAAVMLLGEELLSAKLDGNPISENLRVSDRLLRVVGLQLRMQTKKREQDKRRGAERGEGKPE